MNKLTLGYAFCGSFCTIKQSLEALKAVVSEGYTVIPIMSSIVYTTDTRFGKAEELIREVEKTCGNKIIHDIASAEPIGPKNLLDIIAVSPCTGNTLAKIALGITDTAVTMAVKAHLRNNKPVVLAPATNDALGASCKNLGLLHNTKNIYLVPYRQDDPLSKNNSLVCDFSLLPKAVKAAFAGQQLQPVVMG